MKEPLALIATMTGAGMVSFSTILGLVVGIPGAIYYCIKIHEYYKNK